MTFDVKLFLDEKEKVNLKWDLFLITYFVRNMYKYYACDGILLYFKTISQEYFIRFYGTKT